MGCFKLCIEGPNDIPAAENLKAKLHDSAQNVMVRSVGGWAQVLNENWRPRELSDGCTDLLVMLDGDRARD